jgi:16S rRNA (cytidine1402-2'-O)-methyltransferase
MGTLYIVATPIGNLDDITFRAVDTLKSVDVIACEDTRHTLKLLNHYGIKKPLLSCRSHNEEEAARKIASVLTKGENVAYTSDAGTPGLSDPGSTLATTIRNKGFDVIPIPGVSAAATLLSVAGHVGKTVTFEGFLSPKSGRRRKRIGELLERGEGFIIYESPHRIVKLLEDLADLNSKQYVCIGREMTKLHQEFKSGTVEEVLSYFQHEGTKKGEFSVFVSGKKKA